MIVFADNPRYFICPIQRKTIVFVSCVEKIQGAARILYYCCLAFCEKSSSKTTVCVRRDTRALIVFSFGRERRERACPSPHVCTVIIIQSRVWVPVESSFDSAFEKQFVPYRSGREKMKNIFCFRFDFSSAPNGVPAHRVVAIVDRNFLNRRT